MPIVETKIVTRPNSSVLFYNQNNTNPILVAYRATATSRLLAGTYSHHSVLSNNGLTQTNVHTFANLETYNYIENLLNVEFDADYYVYATTNNLGHPDGGQYTQTGIDQPFSCTTVYTFNPEDINMFESLIDTIETSFCLENFTNTGTVVTAVHHYADSADFSENHWKDYTYTPYLNAEGVTRSITYALL
jgi:hypothetical protein